MADVSRFDLQLSEVKPALNFFSILFIYCMLVVNCPSTSGRWSHCQTQCLSFSTSEDEAHFVKIVCVHCQVDQFLFSPVCFATVFSGKLFRQYI